MRLKNAYNAMEPTCPLVSLEVISSFSWEVYNQESQRGYKNTPKKCHLFGGNKFLG